MYNHSILENISEIIPNLQTSSGSSCTTCVHNYTYSTSQAGKNTGEREKRRFHLCQEINFNEAEISIKWTQLIRQQFSSLKKF